MNKLLNPKMSVTPGFNLPTRLDPKPNKVKYTKPVSVNGIWYSGVLNG